jgi:hypothetical protein
MPTYLNPVTATTTYKVQNTDGLWVSVRPGENVQSYDDLTAYGFVLSSAAPVGTRSDWHLLQFSGERQDTIALGASAKSLDVYNRTQSGELYLSGEVRVYLEGAATYAALLAEGRAVAFSEDMIKSKVSTVVVEALGTALVDVWVRR